MTGSDGREYWFQVIKTPQFDVKGNTIGLVGIARDITGCKRAEEKLRMSEQKLDVMLQSIGDHMSMMDKDYNIVWANAIAKDIFGDDIIGKKCYRVYHGKNEPCDGGNCLTIKTFRDGKVHEHDTQVIDRNGKIIHFHCTANVALKDKDGIPTAVIEISRDITERKQAVEALRVNEEKFRSFVDTASDFMYILDKDGNLTDVNKAMIKVLGYSREELIGINITRLLSKRILANDFKSNWKKFIKDGKLNLDTVFATKDGKEIFGELKAIAIYDDNGKYAGSRAIFYDLTERMKGENALHKSEKFSKKLIESMADGFAILDEKGVHIDVNPALCKMTGFSKDELIGVRPPHPYWPEEEFENIQKAFGKTIRGEFNDFELFFKKKNGERFPVIVSPSQIKDAKGNVISNFATVKDITDRKEVEEERERLYRQLKESQAKLVQSEKLRTIGLMAAGIVHELNNPMMGMLNFTQYCLKHTDKDDRRYTVLKDTEQTIWRCINIVKNMLTLAYGYSDEEFHTGSLTNILDVALRLLEFRIYANNVSVSRKIAIDTPKIPMKTGKIQQLFLNIIDNAIYALDDGKKREMRIEIFPNGEFVEIAISDTGNGIAPGNLDKVFDPFFTTKPVGQGTGLGLSICQNIINEHNGNIVVESEIDKGTTFIITLPIRLQQEAK